MIEKFYENYLSWNDKISSIIGKNTQRLIHYTRQISKIII